MADYGVAVFIWQHHLLVPVFLGDLLCAHARCFWFFENANRHSLWYLRVYVAHWLFPGWVVSGSFFITHPHVCRPVDHISGRVCFFDAAVLRDLCLLYGVWGLATACVFWSALIKATRKWGSKKKQGRAFGLLEGGRNFVDMTSATILMFIFAWRGAGDAALSAVILLLALSTLILAVLVWTGMKDDMAQGEDAQERRLTLNMAGIIEVLKLPMVWLIAIIIMTAYTGLWGAILFTPYATEVFELGAVLGGAVGTGKLWVAFFAAIAAGFLADKIGCARTVVGSFVLMTSGFLVFGFVSGAPTLVPFLLINVVFISSAVYALRGVYFSLLEQGGIPFAVTGTATGIVSVIGYTPDIFMPVLGGMILDASPGAAGYQNLFLVVSAFCFAGLIAAYVVYRKIQVGQAASSK